jgi:phytanoyl-CoA hydroxylase
MTAAAVFTMGTETSEAIDHLPLDTRFTLGDEITPIQKAFLERHGYLIFGGVASLDEIAQVNAEVNRLEAHWIEEDAKNINGVPIFTGIGVEGKSMMQRIPFTSMYSDFIRDLIRSSRFEPVRKLVGDDARVGDNEKDGCVVNTYVNVPGSVYPRLGWHTDGLRDLFYLRMPQQMLNVGLHLTDCPIENGGLRLLPGTHHQGFLKMCFHKFYFLDHRVDKQEVAVETRAGDLTIHDGRLWHRVQQSPHTGAASVRRSMYVPYLTDEFQPKSEKSKTPVYHHLGAIGRKMKLWRHRS